MSAADVEGRGGLWHHMRRQALGVDPCPECECIPHRVSCSRKPDADRFYEVEVERRGRVRSEWEAVEQTYREGRRGDDSGGPKGAPWN